MSKPLLVLDPYRVLSLTAIRLHPHRDTEDAGNRQFHDILDEQPTLGDTDGYYTFIELLERWMNAYHWPVDGNPDALPWGFTHDTGPDLNGIQLWFSHGEEDDQMLIEIVTIGSYLLHGNDYDFSTGLIEELEEQVIVEGLDSYPTHLDSGDLR